MSVSRGPRLFEGERSLIIVGLIGVVLSCGLGILLLLRGRFIGLEGDLLKPIEFNAAVGLFAVTVAALLPLAGFRPTGRVVFRWFAISLYVWGYAHETIQILRGYDPRASHFGRLPSVGTPNKLFALVSILLIVHIVILLWRFFRNRDVQNALLRLGARYGLLSGMGAIAAGMWMIFQGGRHAGASGNILWLHFIGFEGLKVMLLTAWLAQRSPLDRKEAGRWVHLGGIAWLVACIGISVQTGQGLGVLVPTPVMAVTALALAAWGYATWRVASPVKSPAAGDAASPVLPVA